MLWVLLGVTLLLFVLGTPLFIVFGLFSIGWIVLSGGPTSVIPQVMYNSLTPFVIYAVPGFILSGNLLGTPKASERLTKWVQSLVGFVPGGVPVSVAATSEFFGAISGSSPAAVAALGKALYEPLLSSGYNFRFAAGLIAACGAIAIIIPPSIAMLIFGSVTGVSVAKLFIGGIFPGLVVGLCLALYIIITSIRNKTGVVIPFSLKNVARTTKDGIWIVLMPVIVLGGIYGGIFTPTEAAVVAAAYSAVIVLAVYRDLNWRGFFQMAAETAELTAKIFIIVAMASLFSWQLTTSGFTAAFTTLIHQYAHSAFAYLLLVNVALLIVGCFMDPLSATIILAPVIEHIGATFGINGVRIGVLMAVNLAIGMFTPPFGLNIFVAVSVLKIKSVDLYKGLVPFFLIDLVSLLIITYVPWLTLWLPSHL